MNHSRCESLIVPTVRFCSEEITHSIIHRSTAIQRIQVIEVHGLVSCSFCCCFVAGGGASSRCVTVSVVAVVVEVPLIWHRCPLRHSIVVKRRLVRLIAAKQLLVFHAQVALQRGNALLETSNAPLLANRTHRNNSVNCRISRRMSLNDSSVVNPAPQSAAACRWSTATTNDSETLKSLC
jgi:hypothetical protein